MTVMWSALSALFVFALWGMQSILRQREITFTAGQWMGYLVWLLWTLFGIAFVRTSVAEGEPRAARVGALIFGGIAVITAAILARLWVFP